MREYAIVSPRFWTGETGRFLRKAGGDAQRVALYLLTCPNSNMIGLYYLPLPTLCHEVGMTEKGACKALRWASEGQFAYYDSPSEGVFVVEMARFQIGPTLKPKDKRRKAVIRYLEEMAKSPFLPDFMARYQEAYNLPDISPSEAPPKPLRSQDQEQDQEQDQDQERKRVRFVPPTLDEVTAYCNERAAAGKPRIDPETFVNYYTARGWKPKGYTTQMSDWKATIITWEKNQKRGGHGAESPPASKHDPQRPVTAI